MFGILGGATYCAILLLILEHNSDYVRYVAAWCWPSFGFVSEDLASTLWSGSLRYSLGSLLVLLWPEALRPAVSVPSFPCPPQLDVPSADHLLDSMLGSRAYSLPPCSYFTFLFSWSTVLTWLLILADLALIAFLTVQAYKDADTLDR